MCKKIDSFLRENGMHFDSIDMDAAVQDYREEMSRGLSGATSSLAMIPTYIHPQQELSDGQDVLMIDAGGTNLRLAVARFNKEKGVALYDFASYPMLGLQQEITIVEFFEQMADYIEPYLRSVSLHTAGFCFSFNAQITPNRDALVCEFSKEVRIEVGGAYLIGEGINAVLQKRGYPQLRFTILNDTVATMLGGFAASAGISYESHIGFILGTGTNLCYLEDTQNITKLNSTGISVGRMAINCESGTYAGFVQGQYDRELDESSLHPGSYRLEKMLSGVYQGNLIYRTAKGAAKQGLFSTSFADELAHHSTFAMYDIDAFYQAPAAPGLLAVLTDKHPKDRERLRRIIEVSQQRAACVTAITFAATMLQGGVGRNAEHPVCITGEGSGFKKSMLFRDKLQQYCCDYLRGKLGLHFDVVDGENTTFVGAAVAALMEKVD